MRLSPIRTVFPAPQPQSISIAMQALQVAQSQSKLHRSQLRSLQATHATDINFLLEQIVSLRASLSLSQSKIQENTREWERAKGTYEKELGEAREQITRLKRMLLESEEQSSQERRELESKRELERSRASGAVGSRREASQFMEKQLRKLSQQTLEKTIIIENLNRELIKEKKKKEDSIKYMDKNIENIKLQHNKNIEDKDKQAVREITILKDEIKILKGRNQEQKKEIEILEHKLQMDKRERQNRQNQLSRKEEQNKKLKQALDQLRQEHVQEITSLMKERKKKGSNIGSSRSLSSSNVEIGSGRLTAVKEESSPQRISDSLQKSIEEESQVAKAVYHYDGLLAELKKSHAMELDYYKSSCERLEQTIRRKQLELQDALSTFTPLLSLQADNKPIEQDRQQHLQKHWKADVAILDVLLKTNKVTSFY